MIEVFLVFGFITLVIFFFGGIIFLNEIHKQNKYIEKLEQRLDQEKQKLEQEKRYLMRCMYDDKPHDGFGG